MTTLLSPFDPVVWDRARALELFGFDYKIEVYTPAARRRYEYYSLPIVHHGVLVGGLDAKAHRKQGLFEVRALPRTGCIGDRRPRLWARRRVARVCRMARHTGGRGSEVGSPVAGRAAPTSR